ESSWPFAPTLPPRHDRGSERIAGLGEENLQTGHALDRSAMFGVVSVQDTNRLLVVHDRQSHHLGRQKRAHAFEEADVRFRAAQFAAVWLATLGDLGEDRRLA